MNRNLKMIGFSLLLITGVSIIAVTDTEPVWVVVMADSTTGERFQVSLSSLGKEAEDTVHALFRVSSRHDPMTQALATSSLLSHLPTKLILRGEPIQVITVNSKFYIFQYLLGIGVLSVGSYGMYKLLKSTKMDYGQS